MNSTLKSVEYVSGMRSRETAVITRDGGADRVSAAEITASALQLARVQPLLGRTLIDQDARPGAEPVAVIGYSLWQSGFSSDPAVLGQRIQIAETPHLIVGVMPDGFRFPLNQRLWIPLRIDTGGEEPRASEVFVFAVHGQAGSCASATRAAASRPRPAPAFRSHRRRYQTPGMRRRTTGTVEGRCRQAARHGYGSGAGEVGYTGVVDYF